jgi:hypothetical protein
MLERAATPSGLLFLRLRGSISGRGAKEIFEGIDLGELDGESPAKSNQDEVRRMPPEPPEPVLGGAVRGRSMRSAGLDGDNVAIT